MAHQLSAADTLVYSKRLQKALQVAYPENKFTLSACQEIMAKTAFYRDFHESQHGQHGKISAKNKDATQTTFLVENGGYRFPILTLLRETDVGSKFIANINNILAENLSEHDFENDFLWAKQSIIKNSFRIKSPRYFYQEIFDFLNELSRYDVEGVTFMSIEIAYTMQYQNEVFVFPNMNNMVNVELFINHRITREESNSPILKTFHDLLDILGEQLRQAVFKKMKAIEEAICSGHFIHIDKIKEKAHLAKIQSCFDHQNENLKELKYPNNRIERRDNAFINALEEAFSVKDKTNIQYGLISIRNTLRNILRISSMEAMGGTLHEATPDDLKDTSQKKSLAENFITEIKIQPKHSHFDQVKLFTPDDAYMAIWMPEMPQSVLDHMVLFMESLYSPQKSLEGIIHGFYELLEYRHELVKKMMGIVTWSDLEKAISSQNWKGHTWCKNIRYLPYHFVNASGKMKVSDTVLHQDIMYKTLPREMVEIYTMDMNHITTFIAA